MGRGKNRSAADTPTTAGQRPHRSSSIVRAAATRTAANDMNERHDDKAEKFMLAANHWFRYHVLVYLLGNGTLWLINEFTSERWWAFWPLFFWSLFLALHFFLIRSIHADDNWAQRRALALRAKSYDVDHIRAIVHSYRDHTMPGRHDLNPPAEADGENKSE